MRTKFVISMLVRQLVVLAVMLGIKFDGIESSGGR
jgi:hypothetical protein